MPGDVVMATESPVNTLREAFSLFGSAFGVISRLDSF
jgi:hypothetical protein